jgi:hypothetical protein
LNARINLHGDPATLRRFSYQTHLLVETDQPLISGMISWSETVAVEVANPLHRPVGGGGRVAHRFAISAGTYSDPQGTGFNIYESLVSGFDRTVVSTVTGGERKVPYSLPIPIQVLGMPLTMQASVFPGGMAAATPGHVLRVKQVAGPDPVELTTQHLVQTGVDFAVVDQTPPK